MLIKLAHVTKLPNTKLYGGMYIMTTQIQETNTKAVLITDKASVILCDDTLTVGQKLAQMVALVETIDATDDGLLIAKGTVEQLVKELEGIVVQQNSVIIPANKISTIRFPFGDSVKENVAAINEAFTIKIIGASGFSADRKPIRAHSYIKDDKKEVLSVVGYITVQMPRGLGTTGIYTRTGFGTGETKHYDLADVDFLPSPKGGVKKLGTGRWVLEAIRYTTNGELTCQLPKFKGKDGRYFNHCSIIHPLHKLDEERAGRGMPVVRDISAGFTAIARLFNGELVIPDSPTVKTWPDGRVVENSCVTCGNLIAQYQQQDGNPLLTLPDLTLNDKKQSGDMQETHFCAMCNHNPLSTAVEVWNDYSSKDSYDVKAMIGYKKDTVISPDGEPVLKDALDEHGHRIPVYDYRKCGGGKTALFNDKVLKWPQLLNEVGKKIASGCVSHRYCAASGTIPGMWLRAALRPEQCAWFTEKRQKGIAFPWLSPGMPADGHGANTIFTGRVVVMTGVCVSIEISGDLWEFMKNIKTPYGKIAPVEEKLSAYDAMRREDAELKNAALDHIAKTIVTGRAASLDDNDIVAQLISEIEALPKSMQPELATALSELIKLR